MRSVRAVAMAVPAGVVALVVLTTTVACTGSSGDAGPEPTLQPGPQRPDLVAAANLDPCPKAAAGPADAGLPDVTLPCLGDGPAVQLSGLRGPLVVNMWGSWCVPCQKETPYFAQAYRDLNPEVKFLGVDTEDRSDSALDFAAHVQPKMRYPSVVDEDKKVLIGLRLASAVPSTVFVDADGKVVHKSLSPYLNAQDLRADIEQYLGVAG